ncbi:MAG: secretion protein HlyD [Rhodospirillaceae bacterium]|nr:secretion protein HlyD [Rhodospirillaceae bacterium]
MPVKQRLIIAGSVIVLGLIGWFGYQRFVVGDSVTMYGNVDIRQVDLAFMVDGKLAEVLVDEGAVVKTGDVIARLDDTPYRYAAAQAAAALAQAQANADKAVAGSRSKEIDAARAQVAQARAQLANAEASYKRRRELIREDAVSKQALDDAERDVTVARATLAARTSALDLAVEGSRSEDVVAAKAQAAAAQAAYDQAQYRLSQTEIKAPNDGTILTRIREPGTVVGPSAPVLTLSLTTPVWVRTYIDGAHLGRVPTGAKVRVATDAKDGKVYDGTVGFVSPTAEFTPKAVETPELRTDLVYRLRIIVANPDRALRQGMPVTVTLAEPVAK